MFGKFLRCRGWVLRGWGRVGCEAKILDIPTPQIGVLASLILSPIHSVPPSHCLLFDVNISKMSNKRKSDTNCTWTTKMDDALILSYHHAHIAGQRANGQFTQEAFASIVKDLQEQFPTKLLDKSKIKNRMKNIKKNWVRCYDIFKGGLSGFGWDPILQNWTAEADVRKQLIEAKPEAVEWKNKPFRHYNEMVEMFGYDRATGESAVTASKMRHLLATEIDESASTDAPASSTKSQNRAKKAKNDDEQTSKLDDSIGIMAGAFKEMVDSKKLPTPVEELWGIINAMELEEDPAAEAFVFLLKSLVQVKGLMSTPICLRKLVLDKMMKDAK